MICSSSWSLRDPSLSQLSCNDTSCRWSVHSDSSSNRQIIFINIFEGLNNSLPAVQVRFCFLVAWFSSVLSVSNAFTSVQRTLFVKVYCTCKMFFILYLLQQKGCAKTNNLNDNVHTLVFLFSQYFKIHVTTMNDTNEYFFLPNVYSKNTNVCQFALMIDHFE